MSAYIIDCETTGLSEPIQPVCIARCRSLLFEPDPDEETFDDVCDDRVYFFKPTRAIELGAMATHNIIPEDLVDFVEWSLGAFSLPADCEYLIGHNVDFDWAVIGRPPVKRICSLALARSLWPEADSHSLGALQYLLRESNKVARDNVKDLLHSAFEDCLRTAFVLRKCREKLAVNNWEELWQASQSARIPTVMPFGKHKGTPMSQVPKDYVRWLLGQPDVDQYLRMALTGGGPVS